MRIRSRRISGTVLGDGKPMRAIDIALRPAHGFFLSGYHPRGPRLGWVESDENGRFSFPDILPGSYVIVGAIEPVRVDVVRPSPTQDDRIAVKLYGDGCQSASAINAAGKPVVPGS
jgi:hypothetical protein